MRARLLFVAVLLTSAGALPAVSAQQSLHSASITGTVRDPSGGAVSQAPVTLRAVATSAVQAARTDDAGRFTFVGVPPGRYELRVAAPGFAPAVVELTITVGQAIDLPVALTIGDVAARVDVRAETPLLDARRTQAAHTIRQDEIDGLPLNGRNYLDLALLAPGVSRTVQRSTERFAETSAVPGTGISVSSQRNLANTFVVDGLSSDDDAAGLAGTFYAQDVIREFQVITSGAPALFGRAASGVINIVTQSGGNMRRGRAYGYFRDDNLDARNALATREDPLAQQQFGATLSGPVVRNRMFFFANAESTHLARTGVVTIAPSAIDTIAATLGRTGYPSAAPSTGSFDTGYDTTNLFARLDATTASGARVTGRYTFYDVASQNARNVGGLNAVTRGTRLDNRDQTGAMTWATFGSRRFNELRGQATRSRLGAPANDLIGTRREHRGRGQLRHVHHLAHGPRRSTCSRWATASPRPRRPHRDQRAATSSTNGCPSVSREPSRASTRSSRWRPSPRAATSTISRPSDGPRSSRPTRTCRHSSRTSGGCAPPSP